MKRYIIWVFLLTWIAIGYGQVTVSYPSGQTPQQLIINMLSGEGVTLTNGQFNRSSNALSGTNQKIGTFTNPNYPNFPISTGIVMTTGNISVANSPNDGSSESAAISDGIAIDPTLQALITQNLTGATILEFDFKAVSPTFEFEYIFASEEYPEFVCSGYNDVFGFFLTGLDPVLLTVNTRNIALIPGTQTLVAINSINGYPNGTTYPASDCIATNYGNFYQSMSQGASGVGFDGYTVMRENGNIVSGLIAHGNIVQCQTYHMKLSIANAGDSGYDSGVFLKQGSFTSPQVIFETHYNMTNSDTIIAGCNEAETEFRVEGGDNQRNFGFTLSTTALSGTAILGQDYQLFYTNNAGQEIELQSDEAIFNLQADSNSTRIKIRIPETATFPENEIKVLNLLLTTNLCPDNQPQDTLTYYLRNRETITLAPPDELTFCDICTQIGVNVESGFPATFTWTPSHNLDHNNQQNTTANINNTTNYQVIAVDAYDCKSDTVDFTVNITTQPTASFVVDKVDGCVPLTVHFASTTEPSTTELTWILSTNDTIYNENQFDYTFTEAGDYTVTLHAKGGQDCEDEIEKTNLIHVGDYPHADFTWAPDEPNNGRMVAFSNLSTGPISSYYWSFGDGNTSTLSDPTHAYHVNASKTFNILLRVSNSSGCSDDTIKTINVIDNYAFYVPSSFSPNNDGVNELFQPIVSDVFKYHLSIYNRYGECVFQSINPKESWDGSYKGQLCQAGVYIYKIAYIKYSDIETELYKEGSITLIR